MNRDRREGHAVVGADRPRQPVRAEQAFEDRADPVALRRQQPLTPQQVARVLIGDGQRVAVDPIPRPELPFEVRRPQIIRLRGGGRHDTWMRVHASPPPFFHQALARQEIPRGADGRPRPTRMPRFEPIQKLFGPPGGMLAPRVANQMRGLFRDAMGTLMRRTAAIAQRLPAAFVKPIDPLVASLSADVVPRAQFGHRVQAELPIADESLALFHGYRLQPGHRPTSVGPQRKVLPMFPV